MATCSVPVRRPHDDDADAGQYLRRAGAEHRLPLLPEERREQAGVLPAV